MFVKVNTNILKKQGNSMDNNIKDLEHQVLDMKKIVDEINTIWKGNEYKIFQEKMTTFSGNIETLIKQIDSYCDFVKGYNLAEEILDEEFSKKTISMK